MQLINFASIFLAISVPALSAHSAIIARHELGALSVVFYDDTKERGSSFSPNDLVEGVCNTLPGDWLDKPESVVISSGYTCSFYKLQGCEGAASHFSGKVNTLPSGVYNNVESLLCTKKA